MAVPKRKMSKARRDSRRANWKLTVPGLVECPQCHEMKMPSRRTSARLRSKPNRKPPKLSLKNNNLAALNPRTLTVRGFLLFIGWY